MKDPINMFVDSFKFDPPPPPPEKERKGLSLIFALIVYIILFWTKQ